MKTIVYTLIMLSAANAMQAQGFMNKMKNKINSTVDKATGTSSSSSSSSSSGRAPNGAKYTSPSSCGTVVRAFSKKEVSAHMGGDAGGFSYLFQSVKVSGDQLQLVIYEYGGEQYSYSSGGQMQDMGKPAPMNDWYKYNNGCEKEGFCKEFTSIDYGFALLKTAPHIQGDRIRGTGTMSYTFNGKSLGNYFNGYLTHNADSSVVGMVGLSFVDQKQVYSLISSLGPKCTIPVQVAEGPLVSPDGKKMAALHISSKGSGYDAYFLDGKNIPIGNCGFDGMWIRNSGTIFNIESSGPKKLDRNGVLFHTFDSPIDLHTLFISKDDNTMAWIGDHGLYFSNGDVFENASTPYRIVANGKEQIIFMDVDINSGAVYLCRHDL